MDTWWIDEPRLLGSRNPTTAELEQLRAEGFQVLVSLLREDEQAPRYDVQRLQAFGFVKYKIPVKDFHPPTADQLATFVELLAGPAADLRVIVHCQGGTGRTGTFAAAYWIAKGLSASEAIAHVRKARPHAVETKAQEAALEQFARR
jgi:protein-tyrosine phosphatase